MMEAELYKRIQEGDESALREFVEANVESLWPDRPCIGEGGREVDAR